VTVDSYDREIERYGGPDAIDAAELVFAANSTVAAEPLADLTATRGALERILKRPRYRLFGLSWA
jgi:thiopeptide-type bacteriocin biosynthesis protein